jgi:CheY-like chemotaxis protein
MRAGTGDWNAGDHVITRQSMRCLIVDDSPGFRDAARGMLECAGVTVVAAVSNSAQALAIYTNLQPDITLIDVELGMESGFDLAEQLHSAALPDPPPMILISAHAERDIAEMIAASPAIGFVTKLDLSADAICNLLMTRHGSPRTHSA